MTRFKLCLRLVVVVAVLTSNVSGSRISLTASTPTIQSLLTSSLTLRCALEDTTPSSTLVGRSVASTADNAQFVTSMFLFRNDADIASVSVHVPARAVGNTANLNVSGGIPGGQGEGGFLEINLSYPNDNQGGNYTCSVTAIDDIGHTIIYSTSVDIDVTSPTINDLIHHIHTQDLINTAEITALKSQDINNKAEIAASKSQISQLQTQLTESRHIEAGVVYCGELGSRNGAPQSRSPSVTFTTPYTSAPMVHLAVLDAGIHKDYHAYFDVKLVNTDTRGFTVECSVPNPSYLLGYLKVSWLSFP